MTLKDFDELLGLLESKNRIHNEQHRKKNIEWFNKQSIAFDINNRFLDSAFNEYVLNFLKIDFDIYSIELKNKIVEFFNIYYKDLFTDSDLKEFCLLDDVFKLNAVLKYCYTDLRLPFGNKTEDKFLKRKNNFEKKKKFLYAFNHKSIFFPSPYSLLKTFQYKLKDRLIDINSSNMDNRYREKRENEKLENELIFELIKIVTIDNYSKDVEKLKNFRLTTNTSNNAKKSLNDYYEKKMNNESIIELTPKKKG